MTKAERAAFIRPATFDVAVKAGEKKEWDKVVSAFGEQLAIDPNDVEAQDGIIGAIWEKGSALLDHKNTLAAANKAAARLAPVILHLEQLAEKIGQNTGLYEVLGVLYLARSVRLANSSQLPESLAEVEKALVARPNWDKALETRAELTKMMIALQERMKAVQAQIKRSFNSKLNASGVESQRQADVGFSLAIAYRNSDKAKLLASRLGGAQSRRFWTSLGLAPPDASWGKKADKLIRVLSEILAQAPSTRKKAMAAWETASKDDSDLVALDADKILSFLNHRIFSDPWEPSAQPARPPGSGPQDGPRVTVSRERTGGGAPFKQWVGSLQDRGLKWRLVAAAALAVASASLATAESFHNFKRNQAYAALADAVGHRDEFGATQWAAQFLGHRSFAPDPREKDVVAAYQLALVRLAADLKDGSEAQVRDAAAQYRKLVVVGHPSQQ